ncbi:MAG: hypothetical protein F6J86_29775 [Symploca sp. SIO1B1]|nr:hypothetical protein [Symploca sp. SIO1B1]
MNQVIYPTIDLFLYDLQDGLGQSNDKIKQKRRRFWERIYGKNISKQRLAELELQEENLTNYIELLGTQRIERFDYPLDGYYYPVKLGDTYALQIDCSGKENDSKWKQLSLLEQLLHIKQIILKHTQDLPGEIGENWLVWGKLASPNQNPEAIAQDFYEALEIVDQPQWKRDRQGKGTLQGATLFALERPDITPDGLNRSQQMLICLFPHDQTDEQLEKTIRKLYRDLIRIFHYRNKILWVYEQTRQLKDTLKDSSRAVQKIVDSLPQRLTKPPLNLQQLQQDLADALSIYYYYQTNLGYLKEHYSTVKINTNNYQRRIQEMVKRDPNNNLDFLIRFGNFATQKYLTQIKNDYQSLSAGVKPLENFIKAIEGIISIEKTKNERTLNQTVAIASVGIGTASLTASTISEQAEGMTKTILPVPANQATPPSNYWASFGLSLIISLVVGLFSAVITALWLKNTGRTKSRQ